MEVRLEGKESYLLATFGDRVSLDEAIAAYRRVSDSAKEMGVNKIMVDCTSLKGVLTTMARFSLGTAVARMEQTKGQKFAIVGRPPVVDGFGVTVARNRGVRARNFFTVQDALTWLRRTRSS